MITSQDIRAVLKIAGMSANHIGLADGVYHPIPESQVQHGSWWGRTKLYQAFAGELRRGYLGTPQRPDYRRHLKDCDKFAVAFLKACHVWAARTRKKEPAACGIIKWWSPEGYHASNWILVSNRSGLRIAHLEPQGMVLQDFDWRHAAGKIVL